MTTHPSADPTPPAGGRAYDCDHVGGRNVACAKCGCWLDEPTGAHTAIGVGQPGAWAWIVEVAVEMLRNGSTGLAVSCWLESRLKEERAATTPSPTATTEAQGDDALVLIMLHGRPLVIVRTIAQKGESLGLALHHVDAMLDWYATAYLFDRRELSAERMDSVRYATVLAAVNP